MKIDRLIGILALLLQQERVTAPSWPEPSRYPGAPSSGTWKPCAGPVFPW